MPLGSDDFISFLNVYGAVELRFFLQIIYLYIAKGRKLSDTYGFNFIVSRIDILYTF